MTEMKRREVRGAHASRVLAKASRLRALPHAPARAKTHERMNAAGSSFWRDAKTSTRDACAPRSSSPPCLS